MKYFTRGQKQAIDDDESCKYFFLRSICFSSIRKEFTSKKHAIEWCGVWTTKYLEKHVTSFMVMPRKNSVFRPIFLVSCWFTFDFFSCFPCPRFSTFTIDRKNRWKLAEWNYISCEFNIWLFNYRQFSTLWITQWFFA